jgi:hypothetical protein
MNKISRPKISPSLSIGDIYMLYFIIEVQPNARPILVKEQTATKASVY